MEGKEEMDTKETTLEVEGMSCGSCARRVEGALRRLRGVDVVEVKLTERKVRVEHDPALTTSEMIGALVAEGYPTRV